MRGEPQGLMSFQTYPKSSPATLSVDPGCVYAFERALSGMTWILHVAGWGHPVPVYASAAEIDELSNDARMIEIGIGRQIRADQVAGIFWPNARREALILKLEGIPANFGILPNEETNLRDQYEELRAMIEAHGALQLPPFDELQQAPG